MYNTCVVILRFAAKENLWERKLIRRLTKIRRQLNTTMEEFTKELLRDSYKDVSRDTEKLHRHYSRNVNCVSLPDICPVQKLGLCSSGSFTSCFILTTTVLSPVLQVCHPLSPYAFLPEKYTKSLRRKRRNNLKNSSSACCLFGLRNVIHRF